MPGHPLNAYDRAPVTFVHGEVGWPIAAKVEHYRGCATCDAVAA